MRISVIGSGYVGLVSGLCLAERGHSIVCVDVLQSRIDEIQAGNCPIFEKGLPELLAKNLSNGFSATTDLASSVAQTDATIIAVGTPFKGSGIDLQFIEKAAQEIGDALKKKESFHTVIVKSTVVPGTTDTLVASKLEEASGKRIGVDIGLGMNPEFLREGEAVDDFLNPDRIVLGASDERSLGAMEEIYSSFSKTDILRTSPRTAEMIKYTSNAFLASLISFANENANLCSQLGIDAKEVMQGVCLDKRISPITTTGERIRPNLISYLDAGCGFGGSCFPKDVKALISFAEKLQVPTPLLHAAISINGAQWKQMTGKLLKHFPNLNGIRVSVMGVAFKPGTNDIRESPSIKVIDYLLTKGADVRAFDPAASKETSERFGDRVQVCSDMDAALTDTQAVLIMTRWEEFKSIPERLTKLEKPPLVVDGRRMLGKDSVPLYEGIGL